jgi:hypothetical protein
VAPTADDHSAEEWLLLCDALALVAERCKSQVEAERLLLEFARKGWFPRYWFHLSDQRDKAVFHPSDMRGIDPRIWGFSSDVARITVDWATSSVSYLRIEPDPKNVSHHERVSEVLQHLRKYLPVEPLFRIHLVRLHRDDVFGMLRSVGLMPSVATKAGATPERQPVDPKDWFAEARKDNPQRRKERTREYASRLLGLMENAPVTRVWTWNTLRRRLYDKEAKPAQKPLKKRKPSLV